MKKMIRFLKQKIASPAVLAAAVSAVLLIVVLMAHPLIGVADNGDFYRTINGQGIYKLDRYEEDQYFDYFSSRYGIYQYYNDWEKSLFTSQNLYIRAALFLNQLFGPDKTIFDIRFLSVFLIIQLVAGIYMMTDYITWQRSRLQGLLLGAVCVLVFADTAYTAYFNSFYGEGIVFVSTLLLAASALLLTQRRYPPFWLLISVLVNGVNLILTKQQNATEGLPLCLLFILIACFFGLEKGWLRKTAMLGAAAAAVCGILMYVIIPEGFVRINQYHAMTRGALMAGENPEETLEEFEISKQYSVLDGSIYYERYPAADVESEQLAEGFYDRYGFVSLAIHYLTHPKELGVMLTRAANNGYYIRPEAQGNYEREAGRQPGEKTRFFTLYSELKAGYVPKTTGFAVIWIMLVCGLSLRDRQKLMVLLCIMLMGLIQIGTSIIGAGDADMAKHMFLYNVAFDIVSFVCFAPAFTAFILSVGQRTAAFFKRHKKGLVSAGMVVLCLGSASATVQASSGEKPVSRLLIIGHQGEDVSGLKSLAQAYGMEVLFSTEYDYEEQLKEADYILTTSDVPVRDITRAKIPAICIGSAFEDIPGCETAVYRNKAVRFILEGYSPVTDFLEEFTVITAASGKVSGSFMPEEGKNFPFAAEAGNGLYYISCYEKENIISRLLLAEVIREMTGRQEAGKNYFMIDEVYAFSDLNKLCGWADRLHENGIPFLVRIMPLYDNLEYPAFLRFTQVLRYIQSVGGTIIIHEPLVAEEQAETEPLAQKMARFEKALTEEGVHFREMDNVPYLLTMDELRQIAPAAKTFGGLPLDIAAGIVPEMTEDEFSACLDEVNRKWMTFADLQKEYGDETYLYDGRKTEKDTSAQQEEAAFSGFFDISDRVLMVFVGASLVILTIFLLIGRRWYRKKFYR